MLAGSALAQVFGYNITYTVKKDEVFKGFVAERIAIKDFALPKVTVSDIVYGQTSALPADAQGGDATTPQVVLGMERKQPFAVVRIPVYGAKNADGSVKMLSSFTLNVEEGVEPHKSDKLGKPNDVTTSVLSSGTWYKIGITQTGFQKLDYATLASMGVDPSKVNPAKIRIFGNGGYMLSENNAIARPTDLIENAIYVSSTGSTFANGDYILFYGLGPTSWTTDSVSRLFHHSNNLYTDTAYYFVSFDLEGAGLRIATQPSAGAANVTVNGYDYHDSHELDLVNPAGFGKNWYGEQFNPLLGNLSQTFSFNAGSPVDSVLCTVAFANTETSGGSYFVATLNGNNVGSFVFSVPTTGDNIMNLISVSGKTPCGSSTINVNINFTPGDQTGVGYLYYIELNGRKPLTITGDQMGFSDWRSVGAGNVAQFQLQGATASTQVWDVTNPQVPFIMSGSFAGGVYSFTQDAQILHQYAAFNTNNLYTPKYVGQVVNQNLHGAPLPNCIIVTNPQFLSQAQQLADFHKNHDNLKVLVATTDQIYNEFSSGGQDMSAIRDFARMFYKRAGTDTALMPKYLLLFGGASYDYKNRLANNSNFIPVFESAESQNDLSSFCSDDFYGFLDDSEYIENNNYVNALDIAVGRLPARSVTDANVLVSKITTYAGAASLGPWRLSATFVGDKADEAGDHMADADYMATTVGNCSGDLYNEGKVYLDALPIISTPAGPRCPSANAAIDNQVYQGTFMINYNGHGNTQVWSSERILTQDDFNGWSNFTHLPFMVTATCDFGQFDHPQYVSAAEGLVIAPSGGVVCILTTTQAVYAIYNKVINSQYLSSQFTRSASGAWSRFGDAEVAAKNKTYTWCHDPQEIANFRKFALLGDPALTPDFPQYNAVVDSIFDDYTGQPADTMKALGGYRVTGAVKDINGNLVSDFNGTLTVCIYDKPRTVTTISGTNEQFTLQDNIIYRGKATVTNGRYSFKFITPKDIYYFYGNGKISLYAQNGLTDAAGLDTSFKVGGYSEHPILSSEAPIVRPFINDSLFRDGGITGANTSLFVILTDQTGINVSGNLVGHDLNGVLDGNKEAPYALNDFYETAPDTYELGYVNFPLTGLADGKHSLVVTAWDVNDNVGSGQVDFVVIDGSVVDISNLGNYPNPFTNTTRFVFEHNHPMEQLGVKIEIYNTSGGLVKDINTSFVAEGSWSNDIVWDGTDNNGVKLPSGVYVYRLSVTSDRGFVSSAYQKLVIVR